MGTLNINTQLKYLFYSYTSLFPKAHTSLLFIYLFIYIMVNEIAYNIYIYRLID